MIPPEQTTGRTTDYIQPVVLVQLRFSEKRFSTDSGKSAFSYLPFLGFQTQS
jgi:hypothetical protein